MTVDFKNLPCELGPAGELPQPTTPIDGGSIDQPDDDGVIIIIDRVPPKDPLTPVLLPGPGGPSIPDPVPGPDRGRTTPTGGGGGGGGPTSPSSASERTNPRTRTGPGGPPSIGGGPSTGTTPGSGTGTVATGFWVCRNGNCVFTTTFMAGDVGPFGTQAFCKSICSGPSTSGVRVRPGVPTGGGSTGPSTGNPPSTGVPPGSATGGATGGGGGGGGPGTGGWVCRNGVCIQTTSPQPGEILFGTQGGCRSFCSDLDASTVIITDRPEGVPTGGYVCRDGNCVYTDNAGPNEILFGTKAGCKFVCERIETGVIIGVGDRIFEIPNGNNGGGNSGDNTGGGTTGTLTDPREDLDDFEYADNQYPEYDVFDETYLITESESDNPIYQQNNENLDILNSNIDQGFSRLLNVANNNLRDLNDAMGRMSKDLLQASVNQDIIQILYGLSFPDGRPIPESKITRMLTTLLFQGKLTTLPSDYILSLRSRAVFEETIRTQVNFIQKSAFGISRKELNLSRRIALGSQVSKRIVIVPDSRRAVDRAMANMQSLNPSAYEDLTKEYLKLWYILPEDINRRIMVQTSSHDFAPLYIKDNNTIPVTTSSGEITSLPVNYLHFHVSAQTSAGEIVRINHTNDIHRAVTLPNIVEQASLFDAGEEWRTDLTVSSPDGRDLELNYDLSGARQAFYLLELLPSSIEDVTDTDSMLVKRTQARYKITNSTSTIQRLVKYRVYPWKAFPIDHNDPILGHFTTSSTFTFKFTNFNMQKFGNFDGEPLFVRRIPQIIVILPTDKFNYNFYNGYSRLDSWNSRSISFTMSPDSRYYNTGLDKHWLKVEDSYPDEDIDEQINVYGKKGTFTPRAGLLESGFDNETNTEPLPRAKHGFRAAFELASAIYANYNVENGLLWSDIFVRMSPVEYQTFKLGIPGYMIERLRRGEKTGVPIFHNRVDSFIKESRIVSLKDNGTEVPIKLNKDSPLDG